jgi:hypothetical protein
LQPVTTAFRSRTTKAKFVGADRGTLMSLQAK